MKRLYFKCTLETDVIINQKASTVGNQETLDFIPGNNFLGIVAGKLYSQLSSADSLSLFHTKTVKFGDAHPAEVIKVDENNEIVKRSIKIPASFYKPKLDNKEGLYIYHEVYDHQDAAYNEFQPKQCRTGFYVVEDETLNELPVEKSYSIKSAYDRVKRRSAESQMFGYESLQPGSCWLFDVTLEDESYEKQIKKALEGKRRIGRSRTAQYGLVNIEEVTGSVIDIPVCDAREDVALVYADSRLIFHNEYGFPTFQPTADMLGFSGGKINWTKTQIRTFQYAPWNFKRQARDTDRCGIEKGSVFYIEKENSTSFMQHSGKDIIGKYQNEGFGKIIINPDFLRPVKDTNGKAAYALVRKTEEIIPLKYEKYEDPLFIFLQSKQKEAKNKQQIYALVNDFVNTPENKQKFSEESFASQWGTIRKIAMQIQSQTDLKNKLLGEKGYLKTGVAKDKWSKAGRLTSFEKFMDTLTENSSFSEKEIVFGIINLAAEMAKISGGK